VAVLRAVAGIEKKRSILVGLEKEVVARHEVRFGFRVWGGLAVLWGSGGGGLRECGVTCRDFILVAPFCRLIHFPFFRLACADHLRTDLTPYLNPLTDNQISPPHPTPTTLTTPQPKTPNPPTPQPPPHPHQVGHALVGTAVARLLPTSPEVEKLSIIPRTGGALGFTYSPSKTEDRALLFDREIRGQLVIHWVAGGRARGMGARSVMRKL